MICALTVRRLRPGTFEDFRAAFMDHAMRAVEHGAWVRFNMVRGIEDPDQVVTFGFFDGSLEELRSGGQDGYEEQQAAIAPYVLETGTSALFDVVEDRMREPAG